MGSSSFALVPKTREATRVRLSGRLLFALGAVALVLAGCGTGETDQAPTGIGSLTIEEPSDGAEVTVPFTLQVSTDAELGATESGLNHLHVFFDGNESDYDVVTEDTYEISGLSSGEHTITVSLRNADHSAAGVEAEITVTVTGGGTGGEEEQDIDY